MSAPAEQFPFVDHGHGEAARLPYLPLELMLGTKSITVEGLVDSGSTINVLPYDLGVELGAVWEQQTIPVQLTGNFSSRRSASIGGHCTSRRFRTRQVGVCLDATQFRASDLGPSQFLLGI
ncbi:MAG: hypothetical protein ACKV2Q_01720 [Planctomycetaceae bacterium]